MVDLNLSGLLLCTHAALPHLREAAQGERRCADLVNISSVAGRVARSGSGVYNATKFGVGAFSESLRQELSGEHVRVSLVEPGAVETELASHNRPEVLEGLRARFGSMERRHRRRRAVRREPAVARRRERGARPSDGAGVLTAYADGSSGWVCGTCGAPTASARPPTGTR